MTSRGDPHLLTAKGAPHEIRCCQIDAIRPGAGIGKRCVAIQGPHPEKMQPQHSATRAPLQSHCRHLNLEALAARRSTTTVDRQSRGWDGTRRSTFAECHRPHSKIGALSGSSGSTNSLNSETERSGHQEGGSGVCVNTTSSMYPRWQQSSSRSAEISTRSQERFWLQNVHVNSARRSKHH